LVEHAANFPLFLVEHVDLYEQTLKTLRSMSPLAVL